MRITGIETILLGCELPPHQAWRWNGGSIDGWTAAFVRVHSDAGLHGLGEIYFGAFVPEMIPPVVADLERLLLGEDPFRIPYLWRKMNSVTKFWNRHGFGKSVIAGVDLALYDLAGKAVGLPVYQLLGGLAHPAMRTYASGGCSESEEALLCELRQAREAGFRGFKWRLLEAGRAATLMGRLRAEAGDEFDLMVDLVQGSAPQPWPNATVIQVAEALAPFRPRFLEEPFAIEDKRSYRELRARVSCAVAGGEGVSSLEEACEFVRDKAVDVLQPDVTIAGGITLCKTIGAVASAEHVDLAMHSWGGAGSLLANLHFALANPGSVLVEYCRLASPFREALFAEPLHIVEGSILPPESPGLGIRLTDDIIHRYPYRKSAGHSFAWSDGEPARRAVPELS